MDYIHENIQEILVEKEPKKRVSKEKWTRLYFSISYSMRWKFGTTIRDHNKTFANIYRIHYPTKYRRTERHESEFDSLRTLKNGNDLPPPSLN